MPLLEWNNKYSVKVERIDAQHKNLIEIINNLHDSLRENTFHEELRKIYSELVEYTEYHFTTEEMYLEKAGYEDLENHKKQHARFVKKLKRLQSRCNEGKEAIAVELSGFLSNWIIEHILHSDMEYSDVVTNSKWYTKHKKSA